MGKKKSKNHHIRQTVYEKHNSHEKYCLIDGSVSLYLLFLSRFGANSTFTQYYLANSLMHYLYLCSKIETRNAKSYYSIDLGKYFSIINA